MINLRLTYSLLLSITKENSDCLVRIRNYTGRRQNKRHQFAQGDTVPIDRSLDRRHARLWRGNPRPNVHGLWRLCDGEVFLLGAGN